MARTLLLIIGSLSLLAWTGGTEDPPWAGGGPVGIVGGEETDDYPAVGALVQDEGDGYIVFFCTATLIAPDLVLTAGHCFDGASPTWVFFGTNVFAGTGQFEDVDSWEIHPLWDGLEDEGSVGYDMALIRLQSAVSGIAPIPLYEGAASTLQGDTVRYVGFGDSDGASESTTKRTATSVVDDADYFDLFITSRLSGSPCYGDSGGPMLVEGGDGLTVAGVNSFVIDACGDRVGATRVGEYLDWIDDPEDWEPPEGDDDDAGDDDDDDPEVETVNLDDMGRGSGCRTSLAPGGEGLIGLLLLALAGSKRRSRPSRSAR